MTKKHTYTRLLKLIGYKKKSSSKKKNSNDISNTSIASDLKIFIMRPGKQKQNELKWMGGRK